MTRVALTRVQVCSRSYVTGNHNFQCDGVVFYPPELLPGYCAIFRHANNELGWCVYVIPGMKLFEYI